MWWLLLPVAFVVCVVVVSAVGAALNSGPKHPRHAAPRHLEAVPDLPPDWGSMVLDEERTVEWQPPAYLLAAPVDPEPWKLRLPTAEERTELLAELSPEALGSIDLDGGEGDLSQTPFPAPVQLDPGAGDADVVSSAPAPDPDWLEAQLAILFDWVRHVHAGALA